MKNSTLATILMPLAAALLTSAGPASAQVDLNLQQPMLSGTAGNTFRFFGTITNFGSSPVFLSGDSNSSLAAGLILDDSPSYNTPSALSAFGAVGYSYTGELFDIVVAPGTNPSFYSGTFSLTGGADPIANQYDTLVKKTFGVAVAPVPEASSVVSFSLLLLGGAGLLAFGRARSRKQSA